MSSFRTTVTGHPAPRAAGRLGRLERLPSWLIGVPVALQWAWLALRYGSATLPSAANPAVASGGLSGEGKLEYLRIMGEQALAACATTVWLPCGGGETAHEAEAAMAAAGLHYPVVLKPDIGRRGCGVRRVDTHAQLAAYFEAFPRGERVLLQRYLPEEGEAGVYYLREPGAARGRLVAVLLRHYPRVTGDGERTVAELMAADPRLGRLGADAFDQDLAAVPAAGEEVRLSMVGSARVGGIDENAGELITPALTEAIDRIARDMDRFHAGRFDLKYESLAALRAGHGFRIIEVNGAGARAVQALDPALGLREAFRRIFDVQRRLFAVGHAMRRLGHRPIGLGLLLRRHLNQRELVRRYPRSN